MRTLYLFSLALILTTGAHAQDAFITTWDVPYNGASIVHLNTDSGLNYNYSVDWGNDGVYEDVGVTGDISHNFGTGGLHQVAIIGDFPRFEHHSRQLQSVDQWGDIQWQSMLRSFEDCSELKVLATDSPDLSQCTTMDSMFENCDALTDEDFNAWDVSAVLSMHSLFRYCENFNGSVSNWNPISTTSMESMFENCNSFNEDLNSWDVSNVEAMNQMFKNAWDFNGDVSAWNVASVRDMEGMFSTCFNFNSNVALWDVGNVTDISFMFASARSFNQDIGSWNTSSVESMHYAFSNAKKFDQDLGSWNISNVENFASFFDNTGMSTVNYDNTIIGWSGQNVNSSIALGARQQVYCNSQVERELLKSKGWFFQGDANFCEDSNDVCPSNSIVYSYIDRLEAVINEASCGVSGEILPPKIPCPTGYFIAYSEDGGANFSQQIPVYDNLNPQTIETICICENNGAIRSDKAEVTTEPGDCCPELQVWNSQERRDILELRVTVGTCDEEGLIEAPLMNCPDGSTRYYRREEPNDQQPWTDVLPDYDGSSTYGSTYEISSVCICDTDSNKMSGIVFSLIEAPHDGSGRPCPSDSECPEFDMPPEPQILNSACDITQGVITDPHYQCPEGSTVSYSVDGGQWASVLPIYNQTKQLQIRTRCNCTVNPEVNGPYSIVYTQPLFIHLSGTLLEVGVTAKTCDQRGDLHPPSISCPGGTTMMYSLNGGLDWTSRLPDYEQDASLTIQSRCECNDDSSLYSVSGFVTTSPGCDMSSTCSTFEGLTSASLQVGVTPKTCTQNGDIHPPTGNCPSGTTMRFTIDGGASWSQSLPDYNQDQSITIETRCQCNDDPVVMSIAGIVTTSPECMPSSDCPDFSGLSSSALEVGVTSKTCDQRGDIHPPSGSCPSGSSMLFSIDGGASWTERLPDYNQDSAITIDSRCECRDDPSITSLTSSVTTAPEDCGPSNTCPGFDITSEMLQVGVTPKTCDQAGDVHPPTGTCPPGSSMMFTIDRGVTWTDRLPDYNQFESITIRTTCVCNENPDVNSLSGYVTTAPETCGSGDNCPDFSSIQIASLQVGITPKTCTQNGDIHPPSGSCPSGSSMLFSIDGGANWTERLPDYNQQAAITIETRCECRDDPSNTSISGIVTTNPPTCLENEEDLDIRSGGVGKLRPTVKVYPNPVKDVMTIDISQNDVEKANYTITDMMGRVYLAAKDLDIANLNSTGRQQISLGMLPTGLYLIHIQINDSVSVHRVGVLE